MDKTSNLQGVDFTDKSSRKDGKIGHFQITSSKNIPSKVSMALSWNCDISLLSSHYQPPSWNSIWQNIAVCVSAYNSAQNYKCRIGGGSPVIHRLEDNRQMMNDEDKWHSSLPNVALNKWIPRALLIISMSFPPLCFGINHVNLLIFKFIHF